MKNFKRNGRHQIYCFDAYQLVFESSFNRLHRLRFCVNYFGKTLIGTVCFHTTLISLVFHLVFHSISYPPKQLILFY